ncbi:Mediator of RNA polymerase II transcription subunit 31 [Gracilariopsis chorda]|uniref:Mediator of RNA polymerase II transcription subunit 31 n=1 Tax=Gracilariopsis chorda TaxID=448386 RepID=A0A2V3IZH9_9FLOR|nr:Mediator of RNA polymerase II transcription subunit 31 [Gracilariopsis chorda]|eukprot:PXF47566.1 Mediator of RNA polymerase II transcription subunit 31 [Gracilariopsis chorda]
MENNAVASNAIANNTKDSAPDTGSAQPSTEGERSPDADRQRFEVELEFVQCLANSAYLNFLAQNEYLDSPDFIAYLKYLQYWRRPEYAKFIVFPHALHFLYLLQEPDFREALKRNDYSMILHQQQGYQWQFDKTMNPI